MRTYTEIVTYAGRQYMLTRWGGGVAVAVDRIEHDGQAVEVFYAQGDDALEYVRTWDEFGAESVLRGLAGAIDL